MSTRTSQVVNGDYPLLKMDNALCTPHTAWLIQDTYESYFGEAFDNIVAYASGQPANVVNPDALKRQRA
jgi:D-3-phosphoglycerate dehydrogenase